MSTSKINYGFYNIFYNFKLYDPTSNPEKNFNKYINVLKSLSSSGLLITGEDSSKAVYFNEDFNQLLSDRKTEYRSLKSDGQQIPFYLNKAIKKVGDKPNVQVNTTPTSINVGVEDTLEDDLQTSQIDYLNQLVSMYQSEEQYTGLHSKDYKNRFLLHPPQLSGDGNEFFHPGIYLTVYKHGYACLLLTVDLEDLDFDAINLFAWNLPLEKVYFPSS